MTSPLSRTAVRLFAASTLALMAAYYGSRGLAAGCTGIQCDAYIPLSLLLPLLVLLLVAVTGLLSIAAARQAVQAARDEGARRAQVAWLRLLVLFTLLGILGPIASLAVFRDSPDILVPVSTLLIVLVPLSALSYSLTTRH